MAQMTVLVLKTEVLGAYILKSVEATLPGQDPLYGPPGLYKAGNILFNLGVDRWKHLDY